MATDYGLLASHTVLPCGIDPPVGWVNYLPPEVPIRRLDSVLEALQALGCCYAIGPMAGSTWGDYRLTLPGHSEIPRFPGEPLADEGQLSAFQSRGFSAILRYHSTIGDLKDVPPPSPRMTQRLRARAITVRPLPLSERSARIADLHALIHRAFADQPFFAAIPLADFSAAGSSDTAGTVLVAEKEGRLLGFVRGYPHPGAADIWIIKTLARAPEAEAAGLGSYLLDCAHAQAAADGFTRVVHALMHENNRSRDCSRRCGLHLLRTCMLLGRTVSTPIS